MKTEKYYTLEDYYSSQEANEFRHIEEHDKWHSIYEDQEYVELETWLQEKKLKEMEGLFDGYASEL